MIIQILIYLLAGCACFVAGWCACVELVVLPLKCEVKYYKDLYLMAKALYVNEPVQN